RSSDLEVRQGLSGTGQVVEVAAADRLLDRRLDVRRTVERRRVPRGGCLRQPLGCDLLGVVPALACLFLEAIARSGLARVFLGRAPAHPASSAAAAATSA